MVCPYHMTPHFNFHWEFFSHVLHLWFSTKEATGNRKCFFDRIYFPTLVPCKDVAQELSEVGISLLQPTDQINRCTQYISQHSIHAYASIPRTLTGTLSEDKTIRIPFKGIKTLLLVLTKKNQKWVVLWVFFFCFVVFCLFVLPLGGILKTVKVMGRPTRPLQASEQLLMLLEQCSGCVRSSSGL